MCSAETFQNPLDEFGFLVPRIAAIHSTWEGLPMMATDTKRGFELKGGFFYFTTVDLLIVPHAEDSRNIKESNRNNIRSRLGGPPTFSKIPPTQPNQTSSLARGNGPATLDTNRPVDTLLHIYTDQTTWFAICLYYSLPKPVFSATTAWGSFVHST